MSRNHVCCRVHLIWSTKDRKPMIPSNAQTRLWAYMHATAKNVGLESFAFGGVEDHVHGLVGLSATIPIAEAVQKLKANSSRFVRQEFGIEFQWQRNYCAHSVSVSQMDATMNYIRNQREHHKKRDYRAEMREILGKHGIPEEDIFI
jgi:putative transposase